MHRWSARLMVVTVTLHILHMVRVFYQGACKPPCVCNWVIGVTLFFLTLFLSYSDYLLSRGQIRFWAITVSSNLVSSAPLLGAQSHNGLTWQPVGISDPTLIRFYTLHVIFVPLAVAVLMAVHCWRIRKEL